MASALGEHSLSFSWRPMPSSTFSGWESYCIWSLPTYSLSSLAPYGGQPPFAIFQVSVIFVNIPSSSYVSLHELKHPNRGGREENTIHAHCPSSRSHLPGTSHLKSSVWYLASAEVPACWVGQETESDGDFEVGINTGDMDEPRKFKNYLGTSDLSDSIRT